MFIPFHWFGFRFLVSDFQRLQPAQQFLRFIILVVKCKSFEQNQVNAIKHAQHYPAVHKVHRSLKRLSEKKVKLYFET